MAVFVVLVKEADAKDEYSIDGVYLNLSDAIRATTRCYANKSEDGQQDPVTWISRQWLDAKSDTFETGHISLEARIEECDVKISEEDVLDSVAAAGV